MAKLINIGNKTEDVEFFTFEKFDYNEDKFKDELEKYKKIEDEFENIFKYSSKRYLVVGNHNNSLILVQYSFESDYENKEKSILNGFYVLDDNRFNVGDILIIEEKGGYSYNRDDKDDKVLKLGLDFKDLNNIKELTMGEYSNKISLDELDKNISIIDNETLKTEIERIIKQREEDKKEKEREKIEEEKEEKENKQRELEKDKNYQSYKKDSIFKIKVSTYNKNLDIECDKNKLIMKDLELHLKKNFNKLFDFEKLNKHFNNYNQVYNINSIGNIIDELVTKREDFEIINYGDKKQNLKFEFKSNKTLLNNASIRVNRLGSIFNALNNKTLKKDELELFGRISDMMYKFLSLKEFELRRGELKEINIPLKSELINDKNIKITIFEKEKIIEWNVIKDLFYRYGRNLSHDLDLEDFNKLMIAMNIEKDYYLTELKRTLIIGEL